MLYVGLNGDHTILPFNLRTQTAGSKISLPTDPQRGTLNAIDIQVQPGHPENAVITLGLFGYGAYYGQDGLVFLTGGKLTSTFLNTPPNNVAVQGTAFTDSSNLYGWQNYYSGGMAHSSASSSTNNSDNRVGFSGLTKIIPENHPHLLTISESKQERTLNNS